MHNLQTLYKECVKEVKDAGIKIGNVKIVRESYRRTNHTWGVCKTHNYKKPDQYFEIVINKTVLEDKVTEKFVKQVIIHELLHTCEGCQNHGYEWKLVAQMLMDKHPQYDIQRCNSIEYERTQEPRDLEGFEIVNVANGK